MGVELNRSCLFCKREQDQVYALLVPKPADAIGICDSCVKVCIDLLHKKAADELKVSVTLTEKHGVEVVADVTNTGIPGKT